MIRRSWNATTAEGKYRDQFANALAHRIREEIETAPGVSVDLVDGWVRIADRLYTEAGEPMTPEAMTHATNSADLSQLWEYNTGEPEDE